MRVQQDQFETIIICNSCNGQGKIIKYCEDLGEYEKIICGDCKGSGRLRKTTIFKYEAYKSEADDDNKYS